MEGLRADHRGEAVRAEQVPVADLGLPVLQVRVDLRGPVQGAEQDRSLRVVGGLLLGDAPVVHQRLHERVVVRDLVELTVAQQIGAGVADMGEGEPQPVPQHRGERGAHALQARVPVDQLLELMVGVPEGRLDVADQVTAGRVPVEGGQGCDGDRARHLAVGVPAHTVGDGEQATAGIRRVLVPLTEEADVRASGVAECDGHLRNSRTVLPMRIGTPTGTGVGRVTLERSRYVPLVEPRSSTIHWPSCGKSRACRLEA